MIVPAVAWAVLLLSTAGVLGALLLSGLVGAGAEAAARARRARLVRLGGVLGVLALAAAAALLAVGRPAHTGAAGLAHAGITALWVGLLSLGLRPGRGGPDGFGERLARRGLVLSAGLAVLSAASALTLAGNTPGGPPALVGTWDGRLRSVEVVLLVAAAALLGSTIGPRPRRRGSGPPPGRVVVIATALGVAVLIAHGALLSLPADAGASPAWPFPYRLAPAVTWRFPGVRDQVIVGAEIVVAGFLALAAGRRVPRWRPLLVAAGVVLSVLGLYKALSAMTLDAYPTTYARPAVAPTPDSIGRGQALFASHCAACHGAEGRGDGPAAAGLLQKPADLTAAHTADHTPGDVFWWITHGLGLAMPAFGDQLSVVDRWDLVNFVRTLNSAAARPGEALSDPGPGRILGRES
jgi:putative copper resistance protein D